MWYKAASLILLFLSGLFSPSFSQLFIQFNLPSWSIPLFAISMYIPFWVAIYKQKPKVLPIIFVGILSFVYELLSINLGFPYGTFIYGDLMGGLKVLGQVPLTLPVIYVAMVIGATGLSQSLQISKFKTIIIASLGLSLLDIVIDPSLTKEGIWTWTGSLLGIDLYNVPIQNFIGWFFTSLISTTLISKINFKPTFWTVSGFIFTLSFWLGKSLQYQFHLSSLVGFFLIFLIIFPLNNRKH